MKNQILMGLLFFPRGGSARVMHYLSIALEKRGVPVSLVSGSLGTPGQDHHAETFFSDLDVQAADYSRALDEFGAGGDPIAAGVPLHPSYEDRPGAPDRIFASVSPQLADRLERAWQRILAGSDARKSSIFHLHHLTPQHAAVARLWPGRPVISHLHGTELKFIEAIRQRMAIARALGTDLAGMPEYEASICERDSSGLDERQRRMLTETRWEKWRYGEFWLERLKGYARGSQRLLVGSDYVRDQAVRELDVDPNLLEIVPNGVDLARFDARELTSDEKLDRLRQWLVDDPRGWDESGEPGSIRYTAEDLGEFVDPESGELNPILLYVGRFTAMKRVPLLARR